MNSLVWIVVCVILIIGLFSHHYLVHGYPFDTGDFLALASHEGLISILAIFVFVLLVRRRMGI